MPILHQFKLMTSNGFGILLILIERIKIDMVQTLENLHEPPVGLKRTNELNDNEGSEILNKPPKELKMNEEKIKKHREEFEK